MDTVASAIGRMYCRDLAASRELQDFFIGAFALFQRTAADRTAGPCDPSDEERAGLDDLLNAHNPRRSAIASWRSEVLRRLLA